MSENCRQNCRNKNRIIDEKIITPEAVYQNLLDAGCDSKLVDRFMLLFAHRNYQGQLQILSEQRKELLDELHLVQKELDCLDYLIYKIKKLYLND